MATVTALFSHRAAAENAVMALKQRGIPEKDIDLSATDDGGTRLAVHVQDGPGARIVRDMLAEYEDGGVGVEALADDGAALAAIGAATGGLSGVSGQPGVGATAAGAAAADAMVSGDDVDRDYD